MVKTFVISIIGLFITIQLFSQELEDTRKHRLGVSGVYSNNKEQMGGAEISYQNYLKGIRRVEYDFAWLSATSWDVLQFTVDYL